MSSEEELGPNISVDPLDPGYDPDRYARRLEAAQRLILSHIQPLHDQGIIDLDAPARNLTDALDRQYGLSGDQVGTSQHDISADEAEAARAGGYWLAGNQGWCNHLT